MPWAYYNEFDKFAAAWLRELIRRGLIADGFVDERPIQNVSPDDVAEYRQCHWFAGIGTWSYALRQAGWPDDRPVWTGSCPCQPFSAAGKRKSHDDDRHLWPVWFDLIKKCRPVTVLGEQVASRDGLAWFDAVCSDMESEGYAVGAVDIPACGVGAPHIRQRCYFVAESQRSGREGQRLHLPIRGSREAVPVPSGTSPTGELADCIQPGLEGYGRDERNGSQPGRKSADEAGSTPSRGPVNGFWRDAIWIPCRDGKLRPTQPGTFPLAHGAAARVGRLRGYGNAIVAPVATELIKAVMEIEGD